MSCNSINLLNMWRQGFALVAEGMNIETKNRGRLFSILPIVGFMLDNPLLTTVGHISTCSLGDAAKMSHFTGRKFDWSQRFYLVVHHGMC